MQGKKLAAFCALTLITLSQVAAISLEGKKFLGTNCKAGKFDLPEGSSESLAVDGDVSRGILHITLSGNFIRQ